MVVVFSSVLFCVDMSMDVSGFFSAFCYVYVRLFMDRKSFFRSNSTGPPHSVERAIVGNDFHIYRYHTGKGAPLHTGMDLMMMMMMTTVNIRNSVKLAKPIIIICGIARPV